MSALVQRRQGGTLLKGPAHEYISQMYIVDLLERIGAGPCERVHPISICQMYTMYLHACVGAKKAGLSPAKGSIP